MVPDVITQCLRGLECNLLVDIVSYFGDFGGVPSRYRCSIVALYIDKRASHNLKPHIAPAGFLPPNHAPKRKLSDRSQDRHLEKR